jgi:hypothetical protein
MIFIVENETSTKDFVYNMVQTGYEMKWVNNMYDAVYIIEEDTKAIFFSAALIDLDIEDDGLPDYALETAHKTFTGYAFYKHVLCKYPELQSKTILFSNFNDKLKGKISEEEYNELVLVSKSDPDHEKIIIEKLKEWKIRPKSKSH